MTHPVQHPEQAPAPEPASRWLATAVTILFGIFYAYDVWEAVANLIELPTAYAAAGMAERAPWALLIANLLVPALVFALALVLSRRRSLGARAVLLFVGLCLVAVLSLDAIALVPFV